MAQRFRWLWLPALFLLTAALFLPPARAGEASGGKATPVGARAAPTATLAGTIVAFVPESSTLVVDVPLSADVLRVGAVLTPETKIETGGRPASIQDLKSGSRVRLTFRRIATGNEAVAVEVVRGPRH
jgi:hypothetical protein